MGWGITWPREFKRWHAGTFIDPSTAKKSEGEKRRAFQAFPAEGDWREDLLFLKRGKR